MKTQKTRYLALTLASLLCLSALLCSCGGENDISATGDITYKITVADPLGTPFTSGVIVRFIKDGEQKAMQTCDENGVVTKALPADVYNLELAFTDSKADYHYDKSLSVSPENNELTVTLANKIIGEPAALNAGGEEVDVYPITTGGTYAELKAGTRNYFCFTPSTSGNYRFAVVDCNGAQIGYYGAPHFIQSNNVAEVTDNAFTVSVSASMIGSGESGTSSYIIGVDADGETKSCMIVIERIGDALKSIEDEPWVIYKTTSDLIEYTLPEGKEIKEFDLTASTDTYNPVYNEEDGFYHLGSADGPLMLVRLAEDCDYIACFKTILDRSGVSRYFFDEKGELVKKESYSECLLEYIKCVDEKEGVYPLTEDLKFIIQQRGEYVGWWNIESSGYLFKDINGNNDPTINKDIAWLLMCCYID